MATTRGDDAVWSTLQDLARAGLVGGISHDAHILACARAAEAEELATYDRRDFERLDLGTLRMITP